VGALAETSAGGGIAYMAHIGGFVAGLVLVKLFAARPQMAHA
jgi:membrane associated rhomboid family serine protease